MAFAPQLKAANVDIGILQAQLGNDPLFYNAVTVGLWAGGDVLTIDESEQAATPGKLNIFTVSTDPNIAGISNQGTRDDRIRDLVALYGRADLVLTGEKVGTFRYGKVRVRVTDDISAIAVGDIYQAAEDSQTIEEVDSIAVGVADNMAWEIITAAGATAADILALHIDLSEALGWATDALDAASGGDEDDRRSDLILMLQPYRALTSA